MSTCPEITINTKINELPEFEIKTITDAPKNHPTRQFFYAIFIYIRQIIKLYFHYRIDQWNELEEFYDELSADRIERIMHGKKQDRIYFQLRGVHCGDSHLWFRLHIENDPHEGNMPFIEFLDEYLHSLLSFGISLARNTPIYNHEMCFYRRLPIKNVPAEHVTEDVWDYCKHVLEKIHSLMPEEVPEPDIKNVRISIEKWHGGVMVLDVTDISYSIEMGFCAGDGMVVHVREPVTQDIITYFVIDAPMVVQPSL